MLGFSVRVQRTALILAASFATACSSNGAATTSSSSSTGASTSGSSSGSGGSAPQNPYDLHPFDSVHIGSDSSKPNFQHADAEVEFHGGPFADVSVAIDLVSPCFPFDKWKEDEPPDGGHWPPDCDAFDRNFELSFDDPDKPADPPGIEVMRAITPFGGPEHQDIDITDVANGLAAGKHRLRVVIPTYSDSADQVSGSDGGWSVTATIHVVPGAAPRNVIAVIPLFDGEQTTQASLPPIAFDVPAGTSSSRLEFRATGHGGAPGGVNCIGPAEEFCLRTFIVKVDGAMLDTLAPWRSDCQDNCTITHEGPADAGFDYCLQNPCGDPNSVRAHRANWCPSTLTPPFTWNVPALDKAGKHTLAWSIDTLVDGGDWRLSLVYFAFGE